MQKLESILAKKQYELKTKKLAQYAKTLETLLSEEFAKVYKQELLHDMKKFSTSDQAEDAYPSDELQMLRDDFPTILRGTLFLYLVSTFTNQVRKYLNAMSGKELLHRNATLTTIAKELDNIDSDSKDRLTHYKYLRDACAHAEGQVIKDLLKPEMAAEAATHLPGARFLPRSEQENLSNKGPQASGSVELTSQFLPNAFTFFDKLFSLIASPTT